jgi:RNA polymerase sigma-70 factor (ECF subfamily)
MAVGHPAMTQDEVVKAAFQHRDALLHYGHTLLRDFALAEDVLQDAFLVVMRKWQDFQPGTSVFRWVREIVRHKCLEAMRARQQRRASALDDALLAQVSDVMDHAVDDPDGDRMRLRATALKRCMAYLHRRHAEVLCGFYAESASCEEIARAQGRSVNAIRLVLTRLRKQLNECVSRQLLLIEGAP